MVRAPQEGHGSGPLSLLPKFIDLRSGEGVGTNWADFLSPPLLQLQWEVERA